MGRRLLAISSLLALLVAAPAHAQQRTLWPGVTFDTGVQFTPERPRRPQHPHRPAARRYDDRRPGALERDARRDRDADRDAAPHGVELDERGRQRRLLQRLSTGLPSGVLMREGQMASPPSDERSSVRAASPTGHSTCAASPSSEPGAASGGPPHADEASIDPLAGTGIALYTRCVGRRRRPRSQGDGGGRSFPFPAAIPNTDLASAGRAAARRRRRPCRSRRAAPCSSRREPPRRR